MLVIAALPRGIVYAQGDTDCLTTLSHAESEFSAGRFYGIPEMLGSCLKGNRFSNEEQVRVYMLLTQVYLLTDNPAAADDAYLKLLNANPEYVPSDADPIEIVYLSKKFTSTPIFTPHYKVGGNFSTRSILNAETTSSTPDSTQVSRTGLVGWTLGGGVEWNATDNLGIGLEGFLSQRRFKTTISHLFKHDDGKSEERQLWLDIPIYARYQWHKGNIRPFVYAGGSLNLLLSAKIEESFNDRTESVGSEGGDQVNPTEGTARSIMYRRVFLNRSLVFGGGAKFKVGKNFILVDLRYMPGLSNVANHKRNNYSSRDRDGLDPSLTQFAQIGDEFRVNSFSLSVGYVVPIYNPRKATRVNTKSVSRKILKGQDEK